jgi:hypothetical protein
MTVPNAGAIAWKRSAPFQELFSSCDSWVPAPGALIILPTGIVVAASAPAICFPKVRRDVFFFIFLSVAACLLLICLSAVVCN